MAYSNLVATVLQDYRSTYSNRLDKNEQRPSEWGGLNLFKKQTASPLSILDPGLKQKLENSFMQSVQIPVVNYKDVTIGNVRTCALRNDGLNSALVTLTAVTYAWGFVVVPAQHFENDLGYQETVNKLIDAGLIKLATTIDAACINKLEADKNQYFPQSVLDFYPEVGDALQVPQLQKDFFYNQLQGIMATMNYSGNMDIAINHIGMGDVRRLNAQGAGNSTNLGFQMLGYDWFPTARVVNGAPEIQTTLYAVAPGTVALQGRIAPDSRKRTRIHESKYWDSMPNAPYVGTDIGIYYQADCADASAIQAATLAGYTATMVESWELSVDIFYVSAYNSARATQFNPILKAEILA